MIRKVNKTTTVYVCSDGTEFDTLSFAQSYEDSIQPIASSNVEDIKAPFYQVELFVMWEDNTWSDGHFIYVNGNIDIELIEEIAIDKLIEELEKEEDKEAVQVGIFNWDEELYEGVESD